MSRRRRADVRWWR